MSRSRFSAALLHPCVTLCVLFLSTFTLTAKANTYSIVYSLSPDRSNAVPLESQTITGAIYGFVTPETSNIALVEFFLDGNTSRFKSEGNAPYDLDGGPANAADPWNNDGPDSDTRLTDGPHTITTRISFNDGTPDFEFDTHFNSNNYGTYNPTGNTDPTLTHPGNQNTVVNSSVNLQMQATDPDAGDTLTFSDGGTLPPGLSISSNGLIYGEPNTVTSTPRSVTITVNDDNGGSHSQNFTWEITNGTGGGSGSTCSTSLVQEAEVAITNGTYGGNFMTVNVPGASNGQAVEVPADTTSTTNSLTGDYVEYCFDVSQGGTYRILGTALASSGSYNSFNVTVNGNTSNIYAWAFTANNSFVTEAISGGNGSGSTAEFTFNAGINTVRFYLREDGAQLDKVELELISSSGNTAPVLAPINDQTVTVGTSQNITMSATDADGDSLIYSLDTAPSFVSLSGSTLIIDSSSMEGTYTVTVSVSDQTDSDSDTFYLTVESSGGGSGGGASYQILYGLTQDRTGTLDLDGATISGNIYGRVEPETDIAQVRFYLDSESSPFKTESNAPYDLMGGSPAPYDSTSLSDGAHIIRADIDLNSGGTVTISATFTVNNNGSGDDSGGGTGSVADITVDNLDSNTSQTGTWSQSNGPNPHADDSVFSDTAGTFTWTPTVTTAGQYEVYVWWTQNSNRTQDARYTINHANGTSEITNRDQTTGGNQWNTLGTYEFNVGSTDITLTSRSDNGHSFSADAIRFVFVGGDGASSEDGGSSGDGTTTSSCSTLDFLR